MSRVHLSGLKHPAASHMSRPAPSLTEHPSRKPGVGRVPSEERDAASPLPGEEERPTVECSKLGSEPSTLLPDYQEDSLTSTIYQVDSLTSLHLTGFEPIKGLTPPGRVMCG